MKGLSRRQILRMGLTISGAAILAACSPPDDSAVDPAVASTVEEPASAPTAAGTVQEVPTETVITPSVDAAPSQTPLAQLTPTQTNPAAPTEELTFHPTDPSTVQLAAGRPQFVEFFAFW